MKKLYPLILALAMVVIGSRIQAQTSFQFKIVETKVHSDTLSFGDIEVDGNVILNKTSAPLTIDAVRVTNVGGSWTSAFCLDVCYAPFVDSVRYTIPANDSVPYIPHFYIDATPDSQCIYVKIKNASVPTDVAYTTFCGITKIGYGAGMNEYAQLADVKIFPSPVVAGSNFTFNISNPKVAGKEFTLFVYNFNGARVNTVKGLTEGNNPINLDLAAGLYTYRLQNGTQVLRTGKIQVLK